MEKIEHSTVLANGINIHVASNGRRHSPTILFLHGFPELWYPWRHQMLSLSSLGYHCIAPDLRGYGDTDDPLSSDEYTMLHVVGDVIGLLDAIGVEKVCLVDHDLGAVVAFTCSCSIPTGRWRWSTRSSSPEESGDEADVGNDYNFCRFQVKKLLTLTTESRTLCPEKPKRILHHGADEDVSMKSRSKTTCVPKEVGSPA